MLRGKSAAFPHLMKLLKMSSRGFPRGPVALPINRAWVRSLIRELRDDMPQGMAKRNVF